MVSPTPQGGGDVGARPTLIQSVQRALRLIEVIAEHGGRARAKEIARAAGLPLGTTYHLLRTCAHEGWLQRLDDGSYVLGHRIDVVRESGTAARGVAHARPALEWLRDALGGAVYLARHPLHDLTPRTVVERRRLRLPAPDDVAVDDGEYALGVCCVAATVTGAGAVGVVTTPRAMGLAATRQTMLAGAGRVSRALALGPHVA